MGREHGLTPEKGAALLEYEMSAALSDVERMVVRLAVLMTATPVEVPEALFDELRHHFDEPQLVELVSAIAWENYRARFNHALGVESEGFSDGAVCVLPARPAAPPRGVEHEA